MGGAVGATARQAAGVETRRRVVEEPQRGGSHRGEEPQKVRATEGRSTEGKTKPKTDLYTGSHMKEEQEGGAERRSRKEEQKGGAGRRSRKEEQEGGAERRSRKEEQEVGAGRRSRKEEQEGDIVSWTIRQSRLLKTQRGRLKNV
ncbi:unnamed protein product [Boreogadus saida]